MNIGIFYYSGEGERQSKADAFGDAEVDKVFGVERVYDRDLPYSETIAELLADNTTCVTVYELTDLGRNFEEQIATLEMLKGNHCSLRTITDAEEILAKQLNPFTCAKTAECFKSVVI